MTMNKTIRTLSDIKDRCTISGDCWLWGGGTGGNGYPTAKIDGTPRYVRRVAIEYAGRKLIRGRQVTSTCGRITCVNPDHISQNKHDISENTTA